MKVYRDPLLKMVHNPGGHWHPGRGDNPSHNILCMDGFCSPRICTKSSTNLRGLLSGIDPMDSSTYFFSRFDVLVFKSNITPFVQSNLYRGKLKHVMPTIVEQS